MRSPGQTGYYSKLMGEEQTNEEEVVRFVLDGVGVASLQELHDLVEMGRARRRQLLGEVDAALSVYIDNISSG